MNKVRSDAPSLDAALSERLGDDVAPAELSTERRDRMRAKILSLARDTAPADTVTVRHAQGEWQRVTAKIEVKVLQLDAHARRQTLLMRVAPGGFIPEHVHTQPEELFILEGECSIGPRHRLFAGDVHFAASGSRHERITTDTGVMLLIHAEHPSQIAW